MAEYQVVDKETLDADLKSIGDSIRAKGGTTALFNSAAEMAAAVDAIKTGGNIQPEKIVSITTNGDTPITPDAGFDGMAKVVASVNVSSGGGSDIQTGTYTPATNEKIPKWEIDGAVNHFILSASTAQGHGVRACQFIGIKIENDNGWYGYAGNTNAAGSQDGTLLHGTFVTNPRYNIYFSGNATLKVTKGAKTTVEVIVNGDNAGSFGYFVGGVTYDWVAW